MFFVDDQEHASWKVVLHKEARSKRVVQGTEGDEDYEDGLDFGIPSEDGIITAPADDPADVEVVPAVVVHAVDENAEPATYDEGLSDLDYSDDDDDDDGDQDAVPIPPTAGTT